jgi:hypothetical protein
VHHHKKRPHEHPDLGAKRPLFARLRSFHIVGVLLACLLLLAEAVTSLARGRLIYNNYRELKVFAPFSVVIAGLALWAIFVMRKKVKAGRR